MDKKFLMTLFLSIGTVLLLQYYWGRNVQTGVQGGGPVSITQAAVPNQPVKISTTQDFYRSMNTDVLFADEQPGVVDVTSVETTHYTASFSNQGALLVGMAFKDHCGKDGKPLQTITPQFKNADQRKNGCFLLALEEKTPFVYTLLSRQDKETPNKVKITELSYQAENSDWVVKKVFGLHHDSYQIDLTVDLSPKGKNTQPTYARLFMASPYVQEITDEMMGIVFLDRVKNTLEKMEPVKSEGGLAWPWAQADVVFGIEDKYFVHAIIKDPTQFVQRSFIKSVLIPQEKPKIGDTIVAPKKEYFPILESGQIIEHKTWTMSFYMGPKVFDHLAYVDDRLTDLMSFGWLSWLCMLLLKLLEFLFGFLGNYGIAIIVLTFILRIPFMPLSIYSRKKMEIYQKYQPTIQKIRLKFRHDMKMQHEELMKFHQEHNLSTATPMLGCLPLLIQMPILFALYRVLNSYLDLYQAPFFGWIFDLSGKDPYYVIPVLMGVSMIWQQKMTPSVDEKQKFIMWFMSIVFTVIFAKFPAGLVLYWLMNNLISIGEDYLRKYFFS